MMASTEVQIQAHWDLKPHFLNSSLDADWRRAVVIEEVNVAGPGDMFDLEYLIRTALRNRGME